MTVNFSLLALDQIMNTAASFLHMSGGAFNVPVVIRMATGAGRQLGAQHAHSLEGWYAHIPGIRVLAPGTVEDMRGMLWPALEDPDPVLIFEQQVMYNMEEVVPKDPLPVDIEHAKVRRPGKDVTLITYGSCLPKTVKAAAALAEEGIDAEVIDLRVLRPLDDRDDLRLGHQDPPRLDRRRRLAQRKSLGRDQLPDQRAALLRAGSPGGAPVQRRSADALLPPYGGSRLTPTRDHCRAG